MCFLLSREEKEETDMNMAEDMDVVWHEPLCFFGLTMFVVCQGDVSAMFFQFGLSNNNKYPWIRNRG